MILLNLARGRSEVDNQTNRRRPAVEQKMAVLHQLVATMTDEDAPPERRQNAKQSLLKIGDHSIVSLLKEVIEKTQDDQILTDTIDVLGFLPATPDVTDTLLRLLWCESSAVRQSVIRALSRIGDSRVASVLSVIVADSGNPDTIFDAGDGELAKRSLDKIALRARL